MAQSIRTQFHAALIRLLKKEGRGAQRRLAVQQNIDPGYLNAIVKGRKSGSEEVRAKIASHFNMIYEDMLALGRRILDGNEDAAATSEGNTGEEEQATPQTEPPHEDIGQAHLKVVDLKSPNKTRETHSSISEKIMKTVTVLESDTRFSDILEKMIDALYEEVSAKNENLGLRNQVKEMESRIASLEKHLAAEKDFVRKST
jgi:transcriptional regulator with XRE-family HTH domain